MAKMSCKNAKGAPRGTGCAKKFKKKPNKTIAQQCRDHTLCAWSKVKPR